MPKSREKKSGTGKKNVLNMMGYGDDEDDDDDDDGMEAELAAILGGSQPKPKKKAAAPKLLDWSVIDAQVASSMRDVDEGDDDDVTEEDENDLMGELTDLIDEDQPGLLTPGVARSQNRSPSPQPTSEGSMLQLLTDRKQMYNAAIANAQATGQSSKVRRLQRGVKTLDGLLRSAKLGKQIPEDDIPPEVAVGKSASSPAVAAPTSDPNLSSSPSNVAVATAPKSPLPPIKSTVDIIAPAQEEKKASVDESTVNMLESRQRQYRDAALAAKRSGNKEDALKYFKCLKQFGLVIEAAKNGQAVDLSKMPPPLPATGTSPVSPATKAPEAQPRSPTVAVAQSQQAEAPAPQPAAPTRPKTVLEALEQRMAKYQSSADEATKEGNGGKARRMGRIVKQYKDAIRSHKAGRSVNFDELPVPPGYPPIPGLKEVDRSENLMEKASALLQDDVDDTPSSSAESLQHLAAPSSVTRKPSPQRIGDSAQLSSSPSRRSQSGKGPSTAYEQQVVFLQNRQAAFKRAALAAKKRGDKTSALQFLRKMKGFDEMIEAAKSGLKVDITNVPQPPSEFVTSPRASRDDGYEVIEEHEVSSVRSSGKSVASSSPEKDDEFYSRLIKSLEQQIKKSRAYAQQMTHSGDVTGAERADRMAASSQADLDYVCSCRRHGDPPPRFHYQDETFKMIQMNPNLGSDELELVVVQCMDLRVSKDAKIVVDWEMPFPHDNPIKSRTDEGKGSHQNPVFKSAIFRMAFTRKQKSNHRAIKNKTLKLDVLQKGGFLRSDKSIGTASVKLNLLENHCEVHAIEELKEGRSVVGKVEVYVRLRTPLLSSESQTVKERWVVVEHIKRVSHPAPSAKQVAPKSSASSSSAKANMTIAALPVLELELKIVNARIADSRKKGTSSREYQKEAAAIQEKMETTKKYLRDGGSHAQSEYASCLQRQFQHLHSEAQAYAKQGKREQAKLSLTKRSLVKTELEKYQRRKT